ncbi:hypothetical protein MTR_5g072130 [Medicago truncatula]|uniref:Uncharacterized protein n=1 Tax=Medicago truncatula TaxID=3880 RepID=G7K752_MEDTR|nr:hypothetical protein MTR_5g072130 [Medicago truncatula]
MHVFLNLHQNQISISRSFSESQPHTQNQISVGIIFGKQSIIDEACMKMKMREEDDEK